MKVKNIIVTALMLAGINAFAQEGKPSVQVHGFIRNFYDFDTRECVAGTEDFFVYLPKDVDMHNGVDLNEQTTLSTAAITSRLWVEAKGYEIEGIKVGARIEADFYNGLSSSDKVTGTAVFRMRQAFMTMARSGWQLKIGQAWHPMSLDLPDITSLNSGSPFNPFNRSPQITLDYKFGGSLSLTGSLIWQMQYTSTGPDGASAKYIKYGCIPEMYLGLNYSEGGFLGRAGVDMLSIKPRWNDGTAKVSDRITTFSPYIYLQYKKGDFAAKFKTIYAQAGEHLNLNGGYGIATTVVPGESSDLGTSYAYTPTTNSSSWISLSYGKKWQGVLFAGYVKNFGTMDALFDGDEDGYAGLYFSKNSFTNLNSMYRISPAVVFNLGKLAFALEYELTSAQYGEYAEGRKGLVSAKTGLVEDGLHWVTNHRLQLMAKYTF